MYGRETIINVMKRDAWMIKHDSSWQYERVSLRYYDTITGRRHALLLERTYEYIYIYIYIFLFYTTSVTSRAKWGIIDCISELL